MEKIITAVVTTLICSIFNGEVQENKVSKEETKKPTQIKSVEVKKSQDEKDVVSFESIETNKK